MDGGIDEFMKEMEDRGNRIDNKHIEPDSNSDCDNE